MRNKNKNSKMKSEKQKMKNEKQKMKKEKRKTKKEKRKKKKKKKKKKKGGGGLSLWLVHRNHIEEGPLLYEGTKIRMAMFFI